MPKRIGAGLLFLLIVGLGQIGVAQMADLPPQFQQIYLPWLQNGAETGTVPPSPTPTFSPTATASPTPTPTLHPTLAPTATPVPITQYTYRVINRFPHDPQAFTQGLVYAKEDDRELFYEGTGLYGRSSLRRVDLNTGEVLQQRNLPSQYFGEGIAIVPRDGQDGEDGETIVQLTWQSRVGFLYDRVSFEPLGEFSYSTEGWGLTYHRDERGSRLIMSDGSSRLTFRDPTTLAATGTITVTKQGQPVMRLNELEWIEGEVWANVWLTNRIVIIDPTTGNVTGEIDLAGLLTPEESGPADVLNGIAYDPATRRIFVTGKLWPWVFEITVLE